MARTHIAAELATLGNHRAPSVIDALSANRSPYIAKHTEIFIRQLALKPCFSPVSVPQGNGPSEAFVVALKRDHTQLALLPDPQTFLGLNGGWIQDDSGNHRNGPIATAARSL